MKTGIVTFLLIIGGCHPCPAADYSPLQVRRWNNAKVQPYRQHEVKVIADRIVRYKARYQAVSDKTGVPWAAIAGCHNMESGGSFSCHLHEGSPLTARTRFVPKGRPTAGKPPFTWEVSAVDAMEYDRMGEKNWRYLGPALTALEGYNGFGMLLYHPTVATPYLWAGMTGTDGVGKPGKYCSDGRFSPTAVSSQIGIAAIWKELERRGVITIPPP